MNECDIFMTALDIDSPLQRSAYLDQACDRNRMLRMRIEALLDAYSHAGSLLEHPAIVSPATRQLDAIAEQPGAMMGPYRLLRKIGEGGMGVVYKADQRQPVRRTVALKVIKPGMDSRQVIARFAAEKQALALMDHPSIAKVLDAGTTGEHGAAEGGDGGLSPERPEGSIAFADQTPAPFFGGRPYFVMELVDGVPVTEYCDANRLSVRTRLELVVEICRAVQHAHQKGIIHRDLKSSNILIALCDGRPVPKIIDFGVAKATGPKLATETLHTEVGQVVGTLEYMSPEQTEQNQHDIDTRSDIYSLGVLLYELLTGTTPLERRRLEETALLDGLRLVREEEPTRPSDRLSDAEALPTIAANRDVEPSRLSDLVRGELDWIVMKCLEKDRDRRYATAGGLASDVERYLRDEPVLACPPSAAYRFGKFARRHRWGIAVAGGFAAVLIAAVVVSTSLAIRASQATTEARANEKRALEKEREALASAELARVAADAERKVRRSLEVQRQGLLTVAKSLLNVARSPKLARDRRVAEILDSSALEVQEQFDDNATKMQLLHFIAESYCSLGFHAKAIPLWQQIRDYNVRKFGPHHPATLAVSGNLAIEYKQSGRLDEARRRFESLLEPMQRVKGPDHRQTRVIMIHLAAVYRRVGRPDEALPLAEKGFALTETKMGPGHPDTLWAMWNLAKTYAAVSRLDEALELHSERVNRLTTTLGPNHPKTLRAMKSLADAYAAGSRVDDALALYEETLKRMTATLGPDHSNTIAALRGLAEKYARHGRPDKAANAYARLLQNRPDDHGAALRAAFYCLAANDQAGYEAVCRGMLDRFADVDDAWAVNRTSLACLMSSSPVGDIEQLVRLADLAVAAYHDGTGLASRVIGYRTRGLAAYRAGDFQSALDWCRRSRDLESTRTDSSSYLATALVIEAMALARQGKPAEALAAYNESVEMIQRHFPNAPVDLGAYWFNWLMHELLRREATKLLNLDAAVDAEQASAIRDGDFSALPRPNSTDI